MTRIRHGNVAMRFKIETTEGVDSAPDATNAFPFEVDSVEYNSPYRSEASQEANGSLAAGAPLIIGQAAEITFRVRLKGAGPGSVYSASVRPPHHDLLQACGWRGKLTGQAPATITAGTTSSLTVPAAFVAVDKEYIGMPMQLTGGNSGGRLVHVADYTAARVALLTELFPAPLTTTVQAEVPANWSYAPTSPASAAQRAIDHPSGTLYIYEDGVMHRFVGLRGTIDLAGETARPGFITFRFMGTYLSKTDVVRPSDQMSQHSAPTLANGVAGINNSVLLNRLPIAIRQWSLATGATMEVNDDPNTTFGFGAADISRRAPVLTIDPADTLIAVRNVIAEIQNATRYPAVIRCGSVIGNRWSLVTPLLQPSQADPGRRGIYRTQELTLSALNPGLDPQTRDGDAILCFY